MRPPFCSGTIRAQCASVESKEDQLVALPQIFDHHLQLSFSSRDF